MDRACDVCGTTYVAKRATSRYCSAKCRTRKSRGAPGNVTQLPAAGPSNISAGSVEVATERALTAVERVDTPLGQACLVLARRLDASGSDNGSAVAALAKQLEATLASATRGSGAASSPQQLQDELAARRARHGA